MIFIYESQNNFIEHENPIFKNVSAYLEASLIYNCLYHLEEEILNKFDQIIFVTNEQVNESLLLSGFNKYSANVDDYKDEVELVTEIFDRFPNADELLNTGKRKKLEQLIHDIQLKIIEDQKKENILAKELLSKNEDFLIFLPFSKSFSIELIGKLSDDNCYLFADSRSAKLRVDKGYHFISRKSYLAVKQKVSDLKSKYDKKNINPLGNRHFRPTELLENFDNGFFNKVVDLQREYQKRLHFYGQDSFIAKKAIERVLNSVDKYYYYLPQDLNKIDDESQSMVICNFDSVDDPKSYKKLFDKVKNINDSFYIVLQALRKVNYPYFSSYQEVQVPEQAVIRKRISGLFLSLVIEKRLYDDKYWKLFPLVEFNLLENLIPKTESFEYINKAFDSFGILNFNDLIENSLFWCLFQDRITEIINDSKNTKSLVPKKKITFERLGDNWQISGLGKPIIKEYSSIGIKYLIVIMKSKISLEPIDVRNSTFKYCKDIESYTERQKNSKQKQISIFELNESDRKTIGSAISGLKKDEKLQKFIEEHFSFSGKGNIFDSKNKIEIKIIDPDWDDSFIS
jgi:hypothetical protein